MREQLVEIKKGQTGTGLLVESDGFVSLDLKDNRRLCESITTEGGMRELPRPFIVNAVFQKFGIENANGRVYPEGVLKREIEKYQQIIRDRMAIGEVEHPDSTTINLERTAINVIELHWEGRTLVGKLEILITEGFRKYGVVSNLADQMAHLILSGIKIGVSSRAIGTVTQRNGILYVNDDLEIIAFDVVSRPSTNSAFITNTYEELEPYKEGLERDSSKLIKEDKFSKFDKWLNG